MNTQQSVVCLDILVLIWLSQLIANAQNEIIGENVKF